MKDKGSGKSRDKRQMMKNKGKASHSSNVSKYFVGLQDTRIGFALGVCGISFATLAAALSGRLDVIMLMMIWGIGLPGIMLFVRTLSLLLATHRQLPTSSMLYRGSYDSLITHLFKEGFLLQLTIGNYTQFKSHVPFARSHALLIKQEGKEYSIFGAEEIITALSKDILQNLKIDVVDANAKIEN